VANKTISKVSIVLFTLFVSINKTSSGAEYDSNFVSSELQRTQSDPDHSVSFEISAPIEFVFDYLSERVYEYADNAVAVEFNHGTSLSRNEIDVGSERITLMEGNDTLVQRFLIYHPPIQYAYFTDMNASTIEVPLSYSLSRYTLEPINDSETRLDISVVYKSSSRLMAFFVNRAFKSALENDFENAVRKIEAEYRLLN